MSKRDYIVFLIVVIIICILYSYFHSRSIKLQLIKGRWEGSRDNIEYHFRFEDVKMGKRHAHLIVNGKELSLKSDLIIKEKYSAATIWGTNDVSVKWQIENTNDTLLPEYMISTIIMNGKMILKSIDGKPILELTKIN